jgi:hypothetical protein
VLAQTYVEIEYNNVEFFMPLSYTYKDTLNRQLYVSNYDTLQNYFVVLSDNANVNVILQNKLDSINISAIDYVQALLLNGYPISNILSSSLINDESGNIGKQITYINDENPNQVIYKSCRFYLFANKFYFFEYSSLTDYNLHCTNRNNFLNSIQL